MASSLNLDEPRWIVKGVLRTETALHIGDGDTVPDLPEQAKPAGEGEKTLWPFGQLYDKDGKPVEVSSVATDQDGKAYIPASALKGPIRAWLEKLDPKVVEKLLGHQDEGTEAGLGGKAEFLDAPLSSAPAQNPFEPDDEDRRYTQFWRKQRATCIAPLVAIDRTMGAGVDGKLAHFEFVPPGLEFAVEIRGRMSDVELQQLLMALEAFNGGDWQRVALGARNANGWGRMQWALTEIKKIHRAWVREHRAAWIAAPSQMQKDIDDKAQEKLAMHRDKALALLRNQGKRGKRMSLEVTIHMDGPFLVNDVTRTGEQKNGLPGHAPRLDEKGRPVLPSSSIRGSLRQQMEKIVRTIFNKDRAAWEGHDADNFGSVINLEDAKDRLCPVSILAGAPGWKAPLELSDFVGRIGAQRARQDFVAIDRFTGGAAESQKFDAEYVYAPVLTGTIEVDLERMHKITSDRGQNPDWPLILLLYGLRDLHEGDVRLGWGGSKGYGMVREIEVRLQEAPDDVIPRPAFELKFGAIAGADAETIVAWHEGLVDWLKSHPDMPWSPLKEDEPQEVTA
ncbi:MAG: hypothetical protein H6509_15725 [Bryobacterales bacterium]|nr:hypothetical protein [Bryobacterales bacterium]